MKEIFIGSSKEALPQAQQIAAILGRVPGVTPILWTESFSVGEITFVGIESLSRRVVGAVFLASPDDDSVIRDRKVKIPRANVLFEYGFLAARLTRARVALCCYAGVELPSDFSGLTYINMGPFDPRGDINEDAEARLSKWASQLPALSTGLPSTCQLHGYSGTWQIESSYHKWRRIELANPDSVALHGTAILMIPESGEDGTGCIYGTLQIQIADCYAEFEVTDHIVDATVAPDGSIRLRSVTKSRQRIRLQGKPPQQDGFEPILRGAREFESMLYPSDDPGVFRGSFLSEVGAEVYSRAALRYQR